MVYLNVILTVKESADIPVIRDCLQKLAGLSRREPGCLRYEVYHSTNDPRVFILNEHWTDKAAHEQHRNAAGYQTIYAPQVIPRVDRTPHPAELVEPA